MIEVRAFALESVLILGIAWPAARANVLHRLQKKLRAWDLREFVAQPDDYVIRRLAALRFGLQIHKDQAGVGLISVDPSHSRRSARFIACINLVIFDWSPSCRLR
jgi:hypothetical protein